MKNILISTYGTTWYLALELLGFTNPDDLSTYNNHPEKNRIKEFRDNYNIQPADEIWLITTSNEQALTAFQKYKQWHQKHLPTLELHVIYDREMEEIRTIEDCSYIRDLIYRTVLAAHSAADGGQVILSMVGGYKTLSADIQEAGNIFSCHALIHILVHGKPPLLTEEDFEQALPEETASKLMPVVVSGKKEGAAYLYDNSLTNITTENYSIKLDEANSKSMDLLTKLNELRCNAGVLLSNYSPTEHEKVPVGSFRSLALLHPRVIEALKKERIGQNYESLEKDMEWLTSLPKAELHCHFGGILSPLDMLHIALKEKDKVEQCARENSDFAQWLYEIRLLVQGQCKDKLKEILAADKRPLLRTPFKGLPEPVSVCGFIMQFEGHIDLLDEIIYGDMLKEENFAKIGIAPYEHLGDLQGSALMQSEKCLRSACQILQKKCRANHIVYMEIRCSPINYTRGGLSGEMVVKILLEELSSAPATYFSLLFIASRHGRMSDIYRHIELVEELYLNRYEWDEQLSNRFREHFVGFDLAGAENSRSPKQLSEAFESLHKRCLNLTIHAGETAEAESIWEAVYYLSADRIGHGLTLCRQPELLERFIERRITLEMCPSSNFQICGFKDFLLPQTVVFPEYPLQQYMQKGVRVTINTDDPGISRTNLTCEFVKAARMTPGGISKWDILQLLYNSFASTFARYDKRREILVSAELEIIRQIKEQYGTR